MPDVDERDERVRESLGRLAAGAVDGTTVWDRLTARRRQRRIRRRAVVGAVPLVAGALALGVVLGGPGAGPADPPAADGPPPVILPVSHVTADVPRSTAQAPAEDVASVVAGDTRLALGLYREFTAADGQGNLLFSPYSIATALAMIEPGAADRSLQELHDVLGITIGDERYHAARNTLDRALAAAAEPVDRNGDGTPDELAPLKVQVTNGAFGQRGFEILDPFLERLAADYGAGLDLLDFASDPASALHTINEWVAERTEGRITDLLTEDAITQDTLLVLVNAIYFEAAWRQTFEAGHTRPGPFTRLDGSAVEAQMMRQELRTYYADGTGWSAVRLPYQGDASMTVIVPDEGRLLDVEADLSDVLRALPPIVPGQPLPAHTNSAWGYYRVDLSLPRFSFKSRPKLGEALQALGLESLFAAGPGGADLSLISEDPRLHVRDAIHQGTIEVNEKGTIASAATAIVMAPHSAGPPFTTLVVDRPFLVVIRDDTTGAVLFLGRVTDPTAG